ncbi:DUF4062 domain-containing protein [Ralstonia chuxiongensis]|uniref:DUF4062 domain-containing protein n=1 Tax=Ralstonia chuxiongensis TaxID=2957504 RepID=A0AA42BH34_9RALS|nr:DUF4062 domain-containing protein [Ralstonia chuxiongensis]MCP1171628.1 DUF4062 domain-containing protein [Ralstonia chuxiongensis]
MPRTTTIIQIFVASPSDVQPERDALEDAIREINQTWAKTSGLAFELVRWETHVAPAFGSDPQDLINRQIGDDYDVFIGILWSRFGTPTPRAMSGTAEEFERARSRLVGGQNTPELMVYFKDAPIAPSKIDADQLAQVHDFKKSIAQQGAYATFDDVASFSVSVRAHLSMLAQRFIRTGGIRVVDDCNTSSEDGQHCADDEELGLLDHIEIFQTRMENMTAALDLIGEATVRIGEQMSGHTDSMNQLGAAGVAPSPKAAKRLIKLCAADMEAYARVLKGQTPALTSHREAAFEALSDSLFLQHEIGATDRHELLEIRNALETLGSQIHEPTMSIKALRETVAALPRMSGDLNKARRFLVSEMDALIEEFEKTSSTAANVLQSLAQLI